MASSRTTRIVAGTLLALLVGVPSTVGTWNRVHEVLACQAFAQGMNAEVLALLAKDDRSPGAHRALNQAFAQRAAQLRAAPPTFLSPETVQALGEELETRGEAYGLWADVQEGRSIPPRGRRERYDRLLGRIRSMEEANRRNFLRDCRR